MSFNEEFNNEEKENSSFYPKEDEKNEIFQEIDNEYQDNINNSKNEIIFCGCCNSACRIKFKSKTILNIKCENSWKILSTQDFNANYIKSGDLINGLKNIFCVPHNNKYQIYCKHCKLNLCKDCKVENTCQKHIKIPLETDKINVLINYKNNHYNLNLNNQEENDFCRLLDALILAHEQYPNIKTYKSIESACELIELRNDGKIENDSIILKKGISIKNLIGLRKKRRISGLAFNAFNIYLNNMNFKNMKYLFNIWLKNNSELIKLTLGGNNLTNIKYLKNAKLDKLQLLDLSRNKLGDKNIKYISSLQCKNLEELYLHHNMFTDYTIFNEISEKFNLIVFYIGFNKFEKNFDKLKACKFEKLDELGLNYIFDKKTYRKLQAFDMPNLEYLFVQNNGIDSFEFLEKMNIPHLKRLYINKNELKEIDIDILIKFPNLDKVIFDCNSINKIDNIEKINDLKNLEEFSIEYNKLNEDTKRVLKNIKNENKKLKLCA